MSNAPKITITDIQANIRSEYFHMPPPGGTITICVLTLQNGFTVVGESACASPENYDANIGKDLARANATNKIWPLMGYELKARLHRKEQALNSGSSPLRAAPVEDDFLSGAKACDRFDPTCESCQ